MLPIRFVGSRFLCGILIFGIASNVAVAENDGLEDLDEATQQKITAESLPDLNDVVDRLESALEKGLDDDNREFANDLLISTLLQRGTLLAGAALDPRQDRRRDLKWIQLRQFALTDLQRAAALDPKQWDAHLLIGRLQSLPLGDPNAARRALTEVINAADAPDDAKAQALVARGVLPGDKVTREADFSRATELQADSPEHYRVRAQFYYSDDRHTEALADLDKALELEPDHAGTLELRGLVLLGLDRLDEALKSFNEAGELAPNAALPYTHRGEVYRRQGDLKKAVDQLTKALAIAPDDVRTLILRASLYFQLDEFEKSIADVDQVIQLQPQLLEPHLLRAEILVGSKRIDEATAQLERLLPLAPNEPRLLEPLATYYLVAERPRKAIETFTKLIELDPENFRALRFRGDSYLSVGQHTEAVADFDRALELGEADDGLLNNFAWVLATSPDDAIRDGDRALELATKAAETSSYQIPHILSTLAAAYAENGDFENAVKWSEKSVEISARAVESEVDQDGRKKLEFSHKQMQKELESYEAGRPVRERQEQQDAAPADSPPVDSPPPEASQTEQPPSTAPDADQSLDF